VMLGSRDDGIEGVRPLPTIRVWHHGVRSSLRAPRLTRRAAPWCLRPFIPTPSRRDRTAA
jgi:hypothetical protein